MVKPNLKGSAVLLRFREFQFKNSKDKEKKISGHDISFGSSNRFGLNVFGLTVLYCIANISTKPNMSKLSNAFLAETLYLSNWK